MSMMTLIANTNPFLAARVIRTGPNAQVVTRDIAEIFWRMNVNKGDFMLTKCVKYVNLKISTSDSDGGPPLLPHQKEP